MTDENNQIKFFLYENWATYCNTVIAMLTITDKVAAAIQGCHYQWVTHVQQFPLLVIKIIE